MNLKCDKYNGTGNMPLPPKLAKTFKLMQSIEPCYFSHILDMSGEITSTCLGNRIARLISLGLVSKDSDLKYTTK